MADETKPTHPTVKLVEALAWPTTVLVIIVIFWGPAHEIAASVPALLQKSDTISIGGAKLTIRKGSIGYLTPQALAALNKLDGDDIREILQLTTGEAYYNAWNKSQATEEKDIRDRWNKFADLRLAEILPKDELDKKSKQDHEDYVFGVRTTDTFVSVREALIAVTAQIVEDSRTVTKSDEHEH